MTTGETEARTGLIAIDRLPAPVLFDHRLFHFFSDSCTTARCLHDVNLMRKQGNDGVMER